MAGAGAAPRGVAGVVAMGLVAAFVAIGPAAATDEPDGSSDATDFCGPSAPAPFVDRDAVATAHGTSVDCLFAQDVIAGRIDADGRLRFHPSAPVTRAQFAGMLHDLLAAAGRADVLPDARTPRFVDVAEGRVFDREIHRLASAGIVAGTSVEHFSPDRTVGRDQAASLLIRTAGWSTGTLVAARAGPHFADVVGDVHRDAIDAAFEYGLVTGIRRPCGEGGGRFAPHDTLSREQAASVLVRLVGVLAAIDDTQERIVREQPDPTCPSPVWVPDLAAAVAWAADRTGSVALSAIGTDGAQVGHRDATAVPAASVLKVMFLVAYLREPDVRDRALTSADRALLEPMIERSANEPATSIANRLGPGPMQRLADDAGMRDFAYRRPWGLTTTSARDQAAFMFEFDRYVPQRHRTYALELLTRIVPSQRWGIGAVTTDGWTAHFKGGWGAGTGAVDHQVVLLIHDDGTRVAVAVTTTANASHEDGKQTLEGVFRRLLADLPEW